MEARRGLLLGRMPVAAEGEKTFWKAYADAEGAKWRLPMTHVKATKEDFFFRLLVLSVEGLIVVHALAELLEKTSLVSIAEWR